MTFLNPAILFGLIATTIPIILHFLNLRKLKKVEFSTLTFLKELQKTKVRRIKIKQWFLLLLRIMIIVFLVLAFARPTIKSFSFSSSSAKTTAIFVIDNTFSMSIVSSSGSYFNKAKQIAKSLINNFNESDEIAVLPLANVQNKEIKPISNFSLVKREIDELQISFISKTLNEAMIKAGQILFQSKNYNKEIYILTDLQKGQIFNFRNELSNLSSLLNGTHIYLVDIHDKEPNNLGVEKFSINNQIFEQGKTINFSADIKNYSSVKANNTVVSLYVNGRRSAQQSISLSSKESQTINFETTLNDTGLVLASVELEDDDINYDNKRYVSFYVPNKINVLILTDNREDSKFVKLTFSNRDVQTFQISENNLSLISSINLEKYDVVLVIGSEKISEPSRLKSYIEKGGRLVLMPGWQSTLTSFQNLCKNLDLDAPSTLVGFRGSQEIAAQFEKVDFQHPLFVDLFEDKNKTKIESPDIYYYAKIIPQSSGRKIISLHDNSAFLTEYNIGLGKVLLFNSSPSLSWNNFPLKSLFAPLMNKIVLYLSSKVKEQNELLAGDEIVVNIQGFTSKQVKITRPDNSIEFISTDSIRNNNFLSYNKTDLTGTYKFYSDKKLIDFYSINHNPKESTTEYESINNFEEYLREIGYNGNLTNLQLDKDLSRTIYQSRFGIELWKYFLVLALILAIIEMFLAKSSKKERNKKN